MPAWSLALAIVSALTPPITPQTSRIDPQLAEQKLQQLERIACVMCPEDEGGLDS